MDLASPYIWGKPDWPGETGHVGAQFGRPGGRNGRCDAQHRQQADARATVQLAGALFPGQFEEACKKSAAIVRAAVDKGHFWQAAPQMNERQRKVVQKLLDAGAGGFEGGMSAEKYVNITGASKATATRDLTGLAEKYVLEITGQGRGTRYWIAGKAGGAMRSAS